MLRKTMIVLATAAALTGGLTADAVALATALSGWDGLGDGGGAPIASDRNARRARSGRASRPRANPRSCDARLRKPDSCPAHRARAGTRHQRAAIATCATGHM